MKILLCFLLSLGILNANSLYNTKYDKEIKKSVQFYWTDFLDWRFYKAQLYQESLLDENATSYVGAKGLAQFMPKTWLEMQNKLNMPSWASPYMPEYAIKAGAYYMRILRNQWKKDRPMIERHYLALASYNAGLGNILRAQKICNNAILWADIKECLHFITKKHSQETIKYIEKIKLYRGLLNEP